MEPKQLSAGIVVIHRENAVCRYLVLRCYRNWDFPKGMVEADETPFAAARREAREEAAIGQLDFPWHEAFVETTPYGAGKVARYYLALAPVAQASLPVNPELGRPEHHELRWLGYREARALLPPRLLPVIDWAHELSGC